MYEHCWTNKGKGHTSRLKGKYEQGIYMQQAMWGTGKDRRELKGFTGVKGATRARKGEMNWKAIKMCIYKNGEKMHKLQT